MASTTYGSTSEFPTLSYESSNYYVDIMYSTVITSGQQATSPSTRPTSGTAASGTATVTDTLPAGLAWTQDDPGECSIASATLTCHFGTCNRVPHGWCTCRRRPPTRTATRSPARGLLESTATGWTRYNEDLDTLDKSARARAWSSTARCPHARARRPATRHSNRALRSRCSRSRTSRQTAGDALRGDHQRQRRGRTGRVAR